MKHIGIIAVSAEGAALCYRTICLEGAGLLGANCYPEITFHGFPLSSYQDSIEHGQWEKVGELILKSAHKLVAAGAELLICPDNTVHQAIDPIHQRLPAPFIHIAEEVAARAREHRFKRVAVLGTRFLMEGPVYPSKLGSAGVDFQIPRPHQLAQINRIIYDELVRGDLRVESRQYFQTIIHALKAERCDAVALACTEIPLLISDADSDLPVLDSTRILARAVLRDATGERAAIAQTDQRI